MIISHIRFENWRNFRHVDVNLGERTFVVGPNASGKSNLLDLFKFLRDLVRPGGGLQKAISERGGLSKIRCLAARRYPNVEIDVGLAENSKGPVLWRYRLGIKQQVRGDRKPLVAYEQAFCGEKVVLDRPDSEDRVDEERLTQTHLEQISANAKFREIAKVFEPILYLHLIPQLVRHPKDFFGPGLTEDPYGRTFLERLAKTPEKTRNARLKVIERGLRIAVPQLKQLNQTSDQSGIPHLEAVYEHWRPSGAKQRESEFSDGTLRLIGLLWSLLEGESLLLIEEPELSLNAGIVRRMAPLISKMQRKRKRQVIISTHSSDLLSERGIGPEEVLMLTPSKEQGTQVSIAESDRTIKALLESGFSIAEAVLPRTVPEGIGNGQLELSLQYE